MDRLTLDLAWAATSAALARARVLGTAVSVAVVGGHGDPVATAVMDEALLVSPGFAQKKAFAALTFRTATHDHPLAQDPLNAVRVMTADPRLVFAPGGVPILRDGVVVGAVGVAGGTPEQDRDCCAAAVAAIGT